MAFMTFHILGMSSSQLTNCIIFQRGRAQPPTRMHLIVYYNSIMYIDEVGHVPMPKRDVANKCLEFQLESSAPMAPPTRA